ncbi:alpha/beta hydrolase [Streptomyces sp. NPDC050636]|uniref:alpha/beta hydrolase family protein n=1 Tax=Streptomyces sp. NPDC050636 TaxID=3154510 RepID=UPI0034439B24
MPDRSAGADEPDDRTPVAAPGLSRRGALTSLAIAGAGTLTACSSTGPAAVGPATGSPARRGAAASSPTPGAMQLFQDAAMNFNALLALGAAGQHAGEVGEVLTAVNAINTAGASFQTFTDTFRSWGDRLTRQAERAGREGDEETRRWRSLRAAQYYGQALFFVLGTDHPGDEEAVYRAGRRSWDSFAARCRPAALRASVPWGKTRMPVWFFRPDDAPSPRPTVILTNGSDGQNVDMWTYGVLAATQRGWNALVYDGPGQGQLLFVEEIPFSDRWEDVVSPLVDWLRQRTDVDEDRIALAGLSMAGDLAPRAAAFEHRLAALVAMPGCVSPWLGFPAEIRKIVTGDKKATNQIWNEEVVPSLDAAQQFTFKKRLECFSPAALRAARRGKLPTDFWTPAQRIEKLDITGVVPQITAPTLVLDYDDEAFYPGQPQQLYKLLRAPKEYVKLTAAEGAQLHCSPMAPQRHCEVVFDWLADVLHA